MPASNDDRPRLRPLSAYAAFHNGQKLLALHDPSGLAPTAHLPPLAVAVVQLCDGQSTRDEICSEFFRRYQRALAREALDGLLEQLDQALLLDSERFRHHSATLFAEFARSDVRPAHLAGRSYPADPNELRALLDQCFEPPHGPGRPTETHGPLPHALIAPHIDFPRGGPAYAWAYRPLLETSELPELIVIFGTDHNGLDQPFTLTKKHYDTPLGRLTTDAALVEQLKDRAGGERLFADEHHHRGEHSIEFQAVWLRYIYGERLDAIPVLPILCGSLHAHFDRDPAALDEVGGFLRTLTELVAERKTLWLAGADLAHVGPRFGDEKPLGESERAALERFDQTTLAAAVAGDAAGWFGALAADGDQHRVCGATPIYALLAAGNPGRGALAAYGQCPAEEGSVVSIASIVFRSTKAK